MGFYQNRVLPRLIDLSMHNSELRPYRERLLSAAAGRVLEIGIGSGMNLPFYGPRVTQIVGLEPSPRLLEMARGVAKGQQLSLELISASAENIPLPDHEFDTIVTTWTLCSIPGVPAALREMLRVMKPAGQMLFVEHGQAPEESVKRWQDRLTPVWKRIGGGCHLNRPIRELVEGAGFRIEQLQTGYMRGPKPMTYMYEGRAVSA
jgi:ubiquinone/menaquinone biosynthesis C-methylase UbiE